MQIIDKCLRIYWDILNYDKCMNKCEPSYENPTPKCTTICEMSCV